MFPRTALLISLLLCIPTLAGAATFYVNTTQEGGDQTPGDGTCYAGFTIGSLFTKACTLRAAIEEANALAGVDTISFSSTRLVPNGLGVVAFTPDSPLPPVASPMVIDGATHSAYAGAEPWPIPVIHIDGTFAGSSSGLTVSWSGSGSTIRALAIVNFSGRGIQLTDNELAGAQDVVIDGCHIGLHHGANAAGNGADGISTEPLCTGNTIGESCAGLLGCSGHGNVIATNGGDGVLLHGSGNAVAGNRIGSDLAGSSATGFGNDGWGVRVPGQGNVVGDLGSVFVGEGSVTVAAGNLVSGNSLGGIYLAGGGNEAFANSVGTDASGTQALPNGGAGIHVERDENTVGAEGVGSNLVSGNESTGIILGTHDVVGSSSNSVLYNRVGVDATGSAALPNGGHGIDVQRGVDNLVGANLIAGNSLAGVRILTDSSALVQNLVGTNTEGADLGNGTRGIEVLGARNQIGDAEQGDHNIIGHNAGVGITVSGRGNTIRGNFVGTDPLGRELGNGGAGILLSRGADESRIGGGAPDPAEDLPDYANEIAFNTGPGIGVMGDAVRTGMRGNALHDNAGLGIDLGNAGRTPIDPIDRDVGPNNLQNHPELDPENTDLNPDTGLVEVRYRVDTAQTEATYPLVIDFYLAPDGDEGAIWLGSTSYASEVAGFYRSDAFRPPAEVMVRGHLVATATDSDLSGNTSEFSDPVWVPEPTGPMGASAAAGAIAMLRLLRGTAARSRSTPHR